jgi:Cu(I)/Ag(I) efflux system periplasmic protein CusF
MSERVVRAAALSLVVAATLGVAAFGAPAPILAVIRSAAFAEAHAAEAPKIFHGVGVVTAIDAESGALTVDHGDIPGLMDAMEMAYSVRPVSLAKGLKKGDTIAFGVDGKTYTILEIRMLSKP